MVKKNDKKEKKVNKDKKEYNCLCTKCNYNWTSTFKPSECPECGNEGIIIN